MTGHKGVKELSREGEDAGNMEAVHNGPLHLPQTPTMFVNRSEPQRLHFGIKSCHGGSIIFRTGSLNNTFKVQHWDQTRALGRQVSEHA